MSTVEFEATVRGVMVWIHANNFQEDPSVGLSLGPDELYAVALDGQPFELTNAEEERFAQAATDIYRDDCSDEFVRHGS